MKKKNEKTNAERYLEKLGIEYESVSYPHSEDAVDGMTVAELTGYDPDMIFKTLVVTDGKNGYFVGCVPVNEHLSLKKMAEVFSVKKLEMADSKNLKDITGYVRGGCSPFSMKKKFPLAVHSSALSQDKILLSAGKIGFQLKIKPEVLKETEGAKFCDIVMD